MKTRSKTDFIVVHCSATPPKMDVGVKEITRWHLQQSYETIGYHIVIRRDGTVEYGRALDRVGAHAKGVNSISVGVCMVGGVDATKKMNPENNFTAEQFASLEEVVRGLLKLYPGADVIGHRDVPGTRKACPSFDVKQWWAQVNPKE